MRFYLLASGVLPRPQLRQLRFQLLSALGLLLECAKAVAELHVFLQQPVGLASGIGWGAGWARGSRRRPRRGLPWLVLSLNVFLLLLNLLLLCRRRQAGDGRQNYTPQNRSASC